MNMLIKITFLLLPLFVFSQHKDYLVLQKGDTIYGKYITLKNKFTRFRTELGKTKIETKEIKEFSWNNRKYKVLNDPCEGGYTAYRILVEGEVNYLNSGGYEDYCPDLLIINSEIFSIQRNKHFSEEAWELLSKCPVFEQKYAAYYNEFNKKPIVWEWSYRKSRTKYLEMIRFYNANCGNQIIK